MMVFVKNSSAALTYPARVPDPLIRTTAPSLSPETFLEDCRARDICGRALPTVVADKLDTG